MQNRLILALLVLGLLAACSKLNMENYDLLKTGMEYDEVVDIIGSPDSCSEKFGTKSCIWGDEDGSHIKAKFLKQTAIFFSNKKLK